MPKSQPVSAPLNLRVRIEHFDADSKDIVVDFPVADVEQYHHVKWVELMIEERQGLAEDYALWIHARRWGNNEEFARVEFDHDSDPVSPLPKLRC